MTVKLEIYTLKGKEVLVLCSGGIEREGKGNSGEPSFWEVNPFFGILRKKKVLEFNAFLSAFQLFGVERVQY